MRETPRVRLRQRALRGHWSRFPVSPARYERTFRDTLESRDFYSERATFGLARRLEAQLARELNGAVRPAEHVAVLRAFLTRARSSRWSVQTIRAEYSATSRGIISRPTSWSPGISL